MDVSTSWTLFIILIFTWGGGADGTLQEFQTHLKLIHQFECRHPQKRSIRVKELLFSKITPSEILIPHHTVLHRCDAGTGCCEDKRMECKMKESEEIELHFYVIGVFSEQGNYRIFKFTNHTLCACQFSHNNNNNR